MDDPPPSHLLSERKGKVLWLTLNRPHRGNSLYPPLLVDLRKAVFDAQHDEKINVIVLKGAGEKDFCTGIDVFSVKEFSTAGKTNLANVAGDIATLLFTGKPVVVGANGRSMGMGPVFLFAADYRIATSNAFFQMPEVDLGAFPGASCIPIMVHACGLAATKRILMTGRRIDLEEALSSHVIDEVVSFDSLDARLSEVAKDLARKNAVLVRAIKHAITRTPDLQYMKALALETALADWYAWKDPAGKLKMLDEEFKTAPCLTGDPDALLDEYNAHAERQ